MLGAAFVLVCVVVLVIWISSEFKKFHHKIYAIALIALVLFLYGSFAHVFKRQNIDFKSVSGLAEASDIYFHWVGSIFGNFKSITTDAVRMDWSVNSTAG